MSRAGALEISKKGWVRLPKAVRRRWGLRPGSEIAFLDLGDGLVIMPAWAERVPDEPAAPTPHAEQSPPSAGPDVSRPWPPPRKEPISFSVGGDLWEVPWGRHDKFGTAAYWIDQTISGGYADDDAYETMDLKTATVWGLLHGHGVVVETGNAYHEAVMELLKENETPSAAEVAEVLATPIKGFGRYRYPNRKAAFISEAVTRLISDPPPDDSGRRIIYLEGLTGVGPKTARLIEKGLKGLDAQVHINDIWLRRALTHIGVFRDSWNHKQHYDRFEEAFLQYARHGNVPPVALDECILDWARDAGSSAFDQSG